MSTDSKIPSISLDKDLTKHPEFKPATNPELVKELNQRYIYKLSGKLEDI